MKSRGVGLKGLDSMTDAEIRQMISWQDPLGLSALHIAVRNKNVAHVHKLIALGADCTLPDADGNTPLHFAAECGNLEILNVVAEATDDLDLQNNEGETPVILAAHAGFIGALVSLTSMDKHVVPADTSITDLKGRTTLMHACISGDLDLVRLILVNRAGNSQRTSISRVEVNATDAQGVSALMYAAMEGHWHLISLLVMTRANVASKDVNGFTALHWAGAHGNASTVSALIDCGAIIDERDNEQWTPLMHAVNENHVEIVQLLLDSQANCDHCIALANSRAVHLSLCDAIRDLVIANPEPVTLNGRLVISIVRATDLYIDPSSVTNGVDDILVYAVVQVKLSGDAADSEMIGITPGVRIPGGGKITKSIEWNEPIVFFLRDRKVRPDCVISIEIFATRDHTPFSYLFNMEHAAGEDAGTGAGEDNKRERLDQLYKEIQIFEKSIGANDKGTVEKLNEFNFTDGKKRWTQIRESRKRLEKYKNRHIPLPPVPQSHFPCGSISLSFSRLREVFRGNLVAFNRYPRAADRGMVRFDVDYVPSFIVPGEYRQELEIPPTPKSVPPVEAPEELLVFKPTAEDAVRFAPRADKLAKQSRDHYAEWWVRDADRKSERRKKNFQQIETERVKAIHIMALQMVRS